MNNNVRKHGGLIIHILVAIYMFVGLAIVCDDYFVPALDRIAEGMYLLKPYIMGTGVFILDKMLNSLLLCCVLCLLAMLTSIMSAVVLKNTIGRSRPLVNESFILSSKLMIEVKVAKDNDPQAVFEIVSWGSVNLPIHVPAKSRQQISKNCKIFSV